MKMRIEMKKNPDPISTIEIKREDQNMKFLDIFFFCLWDGKERKVRQRKRKRKERKVGLRKKKKNCREREREREREMKDGLEGMMVMMEVPGVLITNGNNNSYTFTTSLIKLLL
ncbi:hypothetical protein ACB098_07G021900 [Castanea mollissima]